MISDYEKWENDSEQGNWQIYHMPKMELACFIENAQISIIFGVRQQ